MGSWSSKFAPKVYEGFLLGYDSNSRAYRVFNKDSNFVETTCDVVFDETNDSQVEQYDLDVVDDEGAPCEASQRMSIGDVRPQDPSEPQATNDTTPPAQGLDQNEHEEKDEQGIEEKDHHTQECIKLFKEITLWTTFLVI
jgi:hypothetical protein